MEMKMAPAAAGAIPPHRKLLKQIELPLNITITVCGNRR